MRKKGSHMIRLRKALLLLATAPLAVPTVAWAQDALPAEPGTGGDQAIVVTGSRLSSTDLTGPAPVTILDRTEIDNTGSTSVGELLRELPVASASASDTAGRGNDGSAHIALRGLHAVNTLVLINGRRVRSNPASGTVRQIGRAPGGGRGCRNVEISG